MWEGRGGRHLGRITGKGTFTPLGNSIKLVAWWKAGRGRKGKQRTFQLYPALQDGFLTRMADAGTLAGDLWFSVEYPAGYGRTCSAPKKNRTR